MFERGFWVRFKTGRHAGITLEEVTLKEPTYARWYVEAHKKSKIAKELLRLENIINKKPFIEPCRACESQATRASAYEFTDSLMFWCDECDPYFARARRGTLTEIRSIADALNHIAETSEGPQAKAKSIVRKFAESKGLPKRIGEREALAFFFGLK